jgi:hypothetical protein
VRRPRGLPAALFALLLFPALPAGAQESARAVEFDDLGFTAPGTAGARATALGALTASVDDVTALIHNPAGLARVKRIHGMTAFTRERLRVDGGANGNGDDTGSSHLEFAGGAVPVRVFRGSLVPAISIHRAFSSGRELQYARDNVDKGRSENWSLQQSGATYAYTIGFGTDLSSTLCAGVSVFLLDGGIDALRQYDWAPLVTNPTLHTYVLEDTRAGVSGYGARVGLQMFLHPRIQIGIQATTPTVVNVDASGIREVTNQIVNDIGNFTRTDIERTTEYILPYQVDMGVAVPLNTLLVNVRVRSTNWAQAGIEGGTLILPSTEPMMDRVIALAVGVEWRPRTLPFKLRAGYEHAPDPMRYLQTDRIDNDRLAAVTRSDGRDVVSAGAGVLIRQRVAVEAAWQRVSASRETASSHDELHSSRITLQGTYWF